MTQSMLMETARFGVDFNAEYSYKGKAGQCIGKILLVGPKKSKVKVNKIDGAKPYYAYTAWVMNKNLFKVL